MFLVPAEFEGDSPKMALELLLLLELFDSLLLRELSDSVLLLDLSDSFLP